MFKKQKETYSLDSYFSDPFWLPRGTYVMKREYSSYPLASLVVSYHTQPDLHLFGVLETVVSFVLTFMATVSTLLIFSHGN